jgi:hypothetical protein
VLTHGDRFLRAALHLCHRAELTGAWVPTAQVCGGWRYRLSPARAYRAALGDEPRRLTGAAIRDVLDSPAPGPFARLWAADLAHHTREETTP